MRTTLRTSLVAGWLTASAFAQTTHLVGPGGFAQIRDALAIAAPGDIIDVQPGSYSHFTANVGVTIRAINPGTVFVEWNPALAPPGCASTPSCVDAETTTVIAPPAGQVVHCIGLYFRIAPPPGARWGRIDVVSGTATFDRCTLNSAISAYFPTTTLRVTGARVHLQECSVFALGTGGSVDAFGAYSNAVVTAVRCHFHVDVSPSIAGVPVRLRSSQFQGSQLQLDGAPFFGSGWPALDLDLSSAAWISDSTITTGGTSCPVKILGGSTCQLDRCVLSSTTCVGLTSGLVVGTDSTTPLQNGAPFTVDYRTDPNQLVAVFASPGLGHVPLPWLTDQPVTIDLAGHWLATALVSDNTGFATVTWNMPPGLFLDTSLFVMGAGVTPTTFALSPPIGGVIR